MDRSRGVRAGLSSRNVKFVPENDEGDSVMGGRGKPHGAQKFAPLIGRGAAV